MSRKIKSITKEVSKSGTLGIAGTGIEGSSKRVEIDIKEYERQLHSMKVAKEKISELPIDEEFLKHAGSIYSQLSDVAKRELEFLLTGIKPELEKKYEVGTNAEWVLPYCIEFIKEYKRIIDEKNVKWRDEISFFKCYPIGMQIILSQYKGLMIKFIKRSNSVNFLTWDRPLEGNVKMGNINLRPKDSDHLRIRSTIDENDWIWTFLCGSEDPKYFSTDRAKQDALEFAESDIGFYEKS
ncbi:MAG: hypothetical protein KAX31_05900 [Thermoplasmata archaeon]|nr:hypothetical protein [Thermoplasmata archaeon]